MPRQRSYDIADVRQIRSLASAIRQDIVDAVAANGPVTIAELADQLGRPADSLYHHVRHLVLRRLLTTGSSERGIGRPAVLLDVPGRPMRIHYDLSSRKCAAAVLRVVGTMLGSAKRGFSRAFHPELAMVSGPRRNLWAARYQCWLTPKDLEEVNTLLKRLGALMLRGARRRTRASRLHEFTYVLSPVRDHPRVVQKRVRSVVSVFVICSLAGAVPAAAQSPLDSLIEGRWQRTPASPRIGALTTSVRDGDANATSRFWSDVAVRGTPLIEPDVADTAQALVTFLWRAAKSTRVAALVDFGQSTLRIILQRAPGTDVWFRTYRVPTNVRFLYEFAVDDANFPFEFGDSTAGAAATRLDPLNPRRWGPATGHQFSLAELPRAASMPWAAPNSSRPHGMVGRFGTQIKSAILGNDRNVWVYKPAAYAKSLGPYPLLVFGASYISQIHLPQILDYLIAARRIPPVVAVFYDWPPGRQDTESGCIPEFGDFLAGELLPWVRSRVRVAADPARVIIGGASAGGLSAACVALRHPEAFGNVLSESGAFWRGFGNTAAYWSNARRDDAERVWFPREVASTPRVPVRFYLTVGTLERSSWFGEGAISMLHVNRQLRDVLVAKGYDVTYREIAGGHDPYNWETALPDALASLLRNK